MQIEDQKKSFQEGWNGNLEKFAGRRPMYDFDNASFDNLIRAHHYPLLLLLYHAAVPL